MNDEVRLSKVERFVLQLGDFASSIPDDIKLQVKEEIDANNIGLKQEFATETTKIKNELYETKEDVEEIKVKLKVSRLTRDQKILLEDAKRGNITAYLGGEHTPEYDIFYRKYMGACGKSLKEMLGGLDSYENIPMEKFQEALFFVQTWIPPLQLRLKIIKRMKKARTKGKLNEVQCNALDIYLKDNDLFKTA